MKRILWLAVAASLCLSCFKGAYYETNYTGAAVFNYRFTAEEFPDSVHIGPFADGVIYMNFLSDVSEQKEFRGGFAFSMKRDSSLVIAEGNKYANLTSCTNPVSANLGSGIVDGFAVFYDSPSKPEHGAVFLKSSTGTCAPSYCMVTNIQPVVKYFLDENSTAKENGDYLKLSVTGYLNGSKTGTAEYVLASADSVNVSWKTLSLTKLGKIDAIDFALESSNPDIPKYFCLDNIVAQIYIKEE